MTRPKLIAVQVLRALAALAVAMHHAQHDAAVVAERSGWGFVRSSLFPWPAGVDVFFVISGFIMVYASADLFGRRSGPRIFLERRIARIVPLYWAVTTLFLVILVVVPGAINSAPPGVWQIATSYLFIPALGADGTVQPVYTLGWTLNYEMFFYAVFAAAIVVRRERAVAMVAVVLGLLVVAGRLFGPLPQPLGFWSEPVVLEFVFGMALGLMRSRGFALGLPVRLVLGVSALVLFHLDLARPGALLVLPEVAAYGIPATLLVAAAAYHRPSETPWRFERAFAALGDASYALYLVHPFVIRAMSDIFLATGLGWIVGPWPFVVVALVAAVAAAMVVYKVFERPMTRSLRLRLGADRPRGEALVARHTE